MKISIILLLVVLTVFAYIASAGDVTPAYFETTDVHHQTGFIIKLIDEENIKHARGLLDGSITERPHFMGRIRKTTANYNPRFSFHLDSKTISFFDIAIEVCDANTNYVEEHLDEACGAVNFLKPDYIAICNENIDTSLGSHSAIHLFYRDDYPKECYIVDRQRSANLRLSLTHFTDDRFTNAKHAQYHIDESILCNNYEYPLVPTEYFFQPGYPYDLPVGRLDSEQSSGIVWFREHELPWVYEMKPLTDSMLHYIDLTRDYYYVGDAAANISDSGLALIDNTKLDRLVDIFSKATFVSQFWHAYRLSYNYPMRDDIELLIYNKDNQLLQTELPDDKQLYNESAAAEASPSRQPHIIDNGTPVAYRELEISTIFINSKGTPMVTIRDPESNALFRYLFCVDQTTNSTELSEMIDRALDKLSDEAIYLNTIKCLDLHFPRAIESFLIRKNLSDTVRFYVLKYLILHHSQSSPNRLLTLVQYVKITIPQISKLKGSFFFPSKMMEKENEHLHENVNVPLVYIAASVDNHMILSNLFTKEYNMPYPTLVDVLCEFNSLEGLQFLWKKQNTYIKDNPDANPLWTMAHSQSTPVKWKIFDEWETLGSILQNENNQQRKFYIEDVVLLKSNYEYLEALHEKQVEYPVKPFKCFCSQPYSSYRMAELTTVSLAVSECNTMILNEFLSFRTLFRGVFHVCDGILVELINKPNNHEVLEYVAGMKFTSSLWPIYIKDTKIPFLTFGWFMDTIELLLSTPDFPSFNTINIRTSQFLELARRFFGGQFNASYLTFLQNIPTLSLIDVFILFGKIGPLKVLLKHNGNYLPKESTNLLKYRTEGKEEVTKIIEEIKLKYEETSKIIEELEGKSSNNKKKKKPKPKNNNNKKDIKKENEKQKEKEITEEKKDKKIEEIIDIKEENDNNNNSTEEIISSQKDQNNIKHQEQTNNKTTPTKPNSNQSKQSFSNNTPIPSITSSSPKLHIKTNNTTTTLASSPPKLNIKINNTSSHNNQSKVTTTQNSTPTALPTHTTPTYDTQIGKFKFNSSDIIGRGSNATLVFRGVWSDRVPVAIKRIVKGFNHLIDKEIEVLIELTTKSSQSSNLVRYIDREEDKNFIYLGLTLCDMSLQQLFEDPTNSELKNSLSSISLINGIVLGVQFLHNNQIVHNDLNPRNILFKDSQLFITDMGLSKMMVESSFAFTHTPSGTGGYYAAEVINHQRKTSSVDIFSLGCLIYYILSGGKHAFGDNIIMRVPNIIMNRFDLKDITDDCAIDLISWMISFEESNRPSIQTVIKHPFFWNIDDKLKFIDKTHQTIKKYSTTSLNTHNNQTYLKESWDKSIDQNLLSVLNEGSQYNFNNVKDLVRCIRNSIHHYQEIFPDANNKKILWFKNQHIAFEYFEKRHPTLLIYLYQYFRDQFYINAKNKDSNNNGLDEYFH
ncbi:putative protein serine/threonine kinase [Heterostelium album PN500]|uniref:non-specific serine/threonine protein kinase n=1 Tax=Heterostelium pallidum (strain ATCC 26659 / Pp 5 / PN500) TaxID=670386 RepID=D3B4R0_HETP5|nr:putative protein serine/threonine kinase [Heterostelium album PN500]EFA84308.1 putative protein serine/threonine kinase [Heterostelium album PN500]|eukprot:XP_020436423.1 putative protein serine/threonine kinase [Heterostelium album PN500]